jgi:hypothetical protein
MVWSVSLVLLLVVGAAATGEQPVPAASAAALVLAGLLWLWRCCYIAVDDARMEAPAIPLQGPDEQVGAPDSNSGDVIVYALDAPHPFVGSGSKVGN